MEKRINSFFFQGMGMGINSFFKSKNKEWELIPFSNGNGNGIIIPKMKE